MLKEIRLSYHLLFRDSPRSQKVYKGLMRQIEKQSLSVDPYLTMLCQGKTTQRGGSGYAYSKSSEFPIFSERLSSLQDFMLRRNPDSLRSIWYDTRDVFKWFAGKTYSIRCTAKGMQVHLLGSGHSRRHRTGLICLTSRPRNCSSDGSSNYFQLKASTMT